jgi:hypothetical protein
MQMRIFKCAYLFDAVYNNYQFAFIRVHSRFIYKQLDQDQAIRIIINMWNQESFPLETNITLF